MDDYQAVRDLLPAPPLAPEVQRAGRERLGRAFAEERAHTKKRAFTGERAFAGERARRPVRERLRWARWSTLGMALAGAAAAATIVVGTAVPAPPGPATTATSLGSGHVLLAAAESVARQPDRGAWWGSSLVNGREFDEPGHRYRLRQTESAEVWIPADPEARTWYRDTYLGAEPAGPDDRTAWQADGSPSTWTYGSKTPALIRPGRADGVVGAAPGEPKTFSTEDWDFRVVLAGKPLTRMNEVPETPEGLRALYGNAGGDQALTDNVVRLLVYAPVTSATRAAAYRLLAAQPGVTAAGQVTDVLGRTGQALEYRSAEFPVSEHAGDTRTRLVVDPATGLPLSIETRTTADGRLLEFTAIRESVWTDDNPLKESK